MSKAQEGAWRCDSRNPAVQGLGFEVLGFRVKGSRASGF